MDRANRPEGTVADIRQGWDVYGSDERKVGNVDRIESGYVVAHKGLFFPKDLYIPFEAIRRLEHDRVYLNIGSDQVATQAWDSPPTPTAAPARAGEVTGARRGPQAPARQPGGDDQTIRLREEQLQATKERVPAGEVRVGKAVVQEQQIVNVPVTREEVVIERIPGDRRPSAKGIEESASETIRIPVSEERVEVEKKTVAAGEFRVAKREVTEQRQVTDTVRREEARIENEGGVRVADAGASRLQDDKQ